ncbi:MAG TPA: alpha/beta hydrolase [Aquabacterium sp.]|nr:alpha/beta hydrolase [Aquabacterium sp.]HRH28138.1 alpha/beta hydrolase [Aquabacterium sp.]
MSSSPRHIVFSHANSFPAGSYESLFETWQAAGYTVHAIDRYGHDPRYPVTRDWPHLVQQLHDFVRDEVKAPAYLVGHSLGGYLSLMMASQHPQWAQGVVVLDSPLLHGIKAAGVGLIKRLGRMQQIMPSGVAIQRTHEWPHRAAAQEHFRIKPKFAAFHPRALNDYLNHGLMPHPEQSGTTLRFKREIEAHIYNTMPHRLLQDFRKHPQRCPIAFIGGQQSQELRAVGLRGTRQLFGPHLSWLPGTHLYPFEHPQATAAEVLKWLQQFSPPPHAA